MTGDCWWLIEYFPASDTYASHGPFVSESAATTKLVDLYRSRTAAGERDVQLIKLHLSPGVDPIAEARRLRQPA